MYYTIYVFSPKRDADHVRFFLRHVLEEGELIGRRDFPYEHQDFESKKWLVFQNDDEIFAYYETHENEGFSLYFNVRDSKDIGNVMFFYTVDGNSILGVDLIVSSNFCQQDWRLMDEDGQVVYWTEHLKEFAGTDLVIYSFEEPPPGNYKDFAAILGREL